MESTTVIRRTINTNEYIKTLPRKKKKEYRERLKNAYRLRWFEEELNLEFINV